MKFIKKHKGLIISIIVLIFVVFGLLFLKEMFFPNDTKAIYGNRLDGIKKLKITDEKIKEVENALVEGTTKVTVRVQGRIIYLDVTVAEATTLEMAKDLANRSLEHFSDEEKAYYDIQAMIDSDTNKDQFPIIGYKHHTKDGFTWTKDRVAG